MLMLNLRRYNLLFMSILLLVTAEIMAQQKVAVVLSGGGAQGMAHIGVLRAFEEHNIPVDLIVGSSAGALVGGLYAAGVSVDEMENLVLDGTIERLFLGRREFQDVPIWERDEVALGNLSIEVQDRQIIGPPGLLDDRLIWKELFLLTASADFVSHGNFDSLSIPFRTVAADLINQEPYFFKSGPLSRALRSSMSIPLVYSPIAQDDRLLVDGGVYIKLPVEVAQDMGADYIIAISTEDPPPELGDNIGISDLFDELNATILASGDSASVKGWDHFFRVDTEGHYVLDFASGQTLMEAGYRAGLNAVEALKKDIERKRNVDLFHQKQKKMRHALDGKSFPLKLDGDSDTHDLENMRRKLGLPDSVIFCDDNLNDIINRLYASGIYKSVIPSFDQESMEIHIRLQEKSSISTRGALRISSVDGFNFLSKTEVAMPLSYSQLQISTNFGNKYGELRGTIIPVSYHKPGKRAPLSVRPAMEISGRYHQYDTPSASQPLSSQYIQFEVNVKSSFIGGWNRQAVFYAGFQDEDWGKLWDRDYDSFHFPDSYDKRQPFIRFGYYENHVDQQSPFMLGWQSEVVSEWKWMDDEFVNNVNISIQHGTRLSSSLAFAGRIEYHVSGAKGTLSDYGRVALSEAFREKYYIYLISEQSLNLSALLSTRFFRDDLRLSAEWIQSFWENPVWDDLDDYQKNGLSAMDIAINYTSILGPLSMGWSFSELEDYKPVSWTRIQITL